MRKMLYVFYLLPPVFLAFGMNIVWAKDLSVEQKGILQAFISKIEKKGSIPTETIQEIARDTRVRLFKKQISATTSETIEYSEY